MPLFAAAVRNPLLRAKLHKEIDRESFATNVKGEMLPGKLSPDDPPPGMHWKGRDLRGGPSGQTGGWRRLPKRLGAVTVGYKCH